MLEAFILGFWAIWAGDREIYAFTESLGFMILVVLLRAATAFELPHIDLVWGVSMAVLWVYVACAFWLVNRVANSFMGTMMLAALAAVGYFWLSQHSVGLAGSWVS
ncbi:MAG: diguanylate cyclase [Neisseria sp.]|nr:diguanylate cyclase [Neisseria sp.]